MASKSCINLEELKEYPEIESAFNQYIEKKKTEPTNVTQLLKFCKVEKIADIKYARANQYFRIRQGLSSTVSSQHSKPSRMYSKYYAPGKTDKTGKKVEIRRSSQPASSISKALHQQYQINKFGSKRRESEPIDEEYRNVDLDILIKDFKNQRFANNNDADSPYSQTSPLSPLNQLTEEEKLEIDERKLRFLRNEKTRQTVYMAMAANATDEHVEEVYDDVDAADAAAIEEIHASVEAAFKALVASMKSHGQRLTQSKEQLTVIDTQMQASKEAIVKEFDVAMGTLLKRRNGLLKALEISHEENTNYLKEQIKLQQDASNNLIQCKDECREFVKNKKTKEAIEAVVNTLNSVRPEKPELASINIEYKQTDPKLNEFLENYGTLSVAKTMRSKKKTKDNGQPSADDAKEDA